MDAEEQRAIEATLRRFATRLGQALFTGEGPDGDLSRVPQLLAEAREMGILADPAPESPGYELGVWGQGCREEGLLRSLLTLSILSEACAGLAAAIHAQGIACLALDGQAHFAPATLLATAFMPTYGVPLSARLSEGSGLQVTQTENVLRLNGSAHFMLAASAPEKLGCFAQRAGELDWVCLVVAANAPGVELVPVTHRTGLRAARQYHVRCDQVTIPHDQVLRVGEAARRSLRQVMACDWLGHAAMALGAARRSLRDSRAFTAQRYQGGQIIEAHAGVQLLQGAAEYDIALLDAILHKHADESLVSWNVNALLRWAIQAKLAIVEHAHRAVTNCLQTLGGYGYMEEYGLEKRLRDVSAFKSLHGAPDQLKLYLNELTMEERPVDPNGWP